jgi:predicted component of type VI protein secretion system
MNAKLVVVLGKTTKREVALRLPAVLGRSREADITVPHPLISRRHCEISENNGVLMVRDLASLNGTMIGGRRIESAPLLPDTEFTIGPLTFRVRYEFDGDLESVPETRFANELEGATEAGLGDGTSIGVEESPPAAEEALPAAVATERHSSDSQSDNLATPELMALADADPEEVFPAVPAPPAPAPPAVATGPAWPPVAIDKLPTLPLSHAPDEPMEFDSSLQSGSHRTESPWGFEPPAVEKLRHLPRPVAGKGAAVPTETPPAVPETPPEAIAAEEAKPPAKEKPPAAKPPKMPNYGEEIDPEFGSFLEGLQ